MFLAPIFGSSKVYPGDIGHSLRFRGAQYISKTITTSATSTYSFFVKRGKLGVISPIVESSIKFNANDTLTAFGMTTTAVFRDPTSWIHVHISNGGLYVNGVRLCAVTTSSVVNGRIGYDGTNYFDGYLARVCVVDGASSSYSNFGYLNTEINEWESKTEAEVKAVVDAGGANSFMLDFDDGTSLTTLGYDKSSRGNNWTLNNFSLTAGPDYDHMKDSPSQVNGGGYATWNPLWSQTRNQVFGTGNLKVTNSTADVDTTVATIALSGKTYWEITFSSSDAIYGYPACGVLRSGITYSYAAYVGADSYGYGFCGDGLLLTNYSAIGTYTTPSSGDVIMYAYDPSNGKLWVGRNGTWFDSGNPSAGTGHVATVSFYASGAVPAVSNHGGTSAIANFGQHPFAYTPPTGFKSLCQANLPTPAIKNPEVHMDVITVTKIGNTNFTIPWNATDYDTLFEIKSRGATGNWYQIDGLRGYNKCLSSNSTAAEVTDANVLTVSGTTCTLGSTLADGTYVISMYKAGLASARQTNTAGSITSTVSANIEAGFSIVTFQLQATGSKTVGHGLGKALNLLHVKSRVRDQNWFTFDAVNGPTKYMNLNTTAASTANSTIWDNTAPTSSVFTVGSGFTTAAYGTDQVAYCHAEIPGYSKFGSYTGNASADGPNPYLGFKAKKLTTKCTTTTDDWRSYDSLRPGYNVIGGTLLVNANALESTAAEVDLDSQSFKLRIATTPNAAQTYIFIAHADVPGKYSLGK